MIARSITFAAFALGLICLIAGDYRVWEWHWLWRLVTSYLVFTAFLIGAGLSWRGE